MSRKYSLIIVILSVLLISCGIWHADVPFGDEAGYISESYGKVKEVCFSVNPYESAYIFLFKAVTDDPVIAHYICRFLTSLFSVVFMYFFLSSFSFIRNEFAILTSCIFWAICRLNIPEVQFGNINLFTLNIIFPSLIMLVRRMTLNRIIFFIFSLFWAAQVRPEYYASMSMGILILACFIIFNFRDCAVIFQDRKILLRTSVLIIVFAGSILAVTYWKDSQKNFDKYLLLGLSQCYTSLYSKLHPEEKISAMVEYSSIVNKVFKNPSGFIDAVAKNPKEALRYFCMNGAINSVILVPGLLRHREVFVLKPYGKRGEMVQISLLLILLMAVSVFAFKASKISLRELIPRFIVIVGLQKLFILLFLGAASGVSIILLIPDTRYWISAVPLLFIWIAWSLSFLYERLEIRYQIVVFAALALIMSQPIFLNKDTNKNLILKMREVAGASTVKQKVAGLYPPAISFFAFKYNCQVISVSELKISDFDNMIYDFVVIDKDLRNSRYWSENASFMEDFEKNPEKHGYGLICRTKDKYDIKIYSKQQL